MGDGVQSARVYRFGAFTLDARTGELSHDGRRALLRDQSLQVLVALLENPGELITREALAARLWADGTFVDVDRGLNKAVNHLRETLGDSADQPRFVETLPRKGYRFIAPVVQEGRDPNLPAPPDAADPVPRGWQRWWWWIAAAMAAGIAIGAAITGVGWWLARRTPVATAERR